MTRYRIKAPGCDSVETELSREQITALRNGGFEVIPADPGKTVVYAGASDVAGAKVYHAKSDRFGDIVYLTLFCVTDDPTSFDLWFSPENAAKIADALTGGKPKLRAFRDCKGAAWHEVSPGRFLLGDTRERAEEKAGAYPTAGLSLDQIQEAYSPLTELESV